MKGLHRSHRAVTTLPQQTAGALTFGVVSSQHLTIERQSEQQWKQLDQFVERTLREALLRCAPVIIDEDTQAGWSVS